MSEAIREEEFSEDVFESMLNGSFHEKNLGVDEEDAVTAEEPDNGDSEYQEDTEADTEDEDDYTGDADDGEHDEEELDEDSEGGEDSLVDDYDLDDEGNDTEEDLKEEDEAFKDTDEDITEESEDNAETEEVSDGEPTDTDAVDYKAFYDAVVNTEFTVNGRKAKGFSDPKKIIQAMQMAGGFSEKMAGFKQYRPFMSPLKDRGMLDDPAKFDLAMNIIDGDKEAIKKHLSSLSIDPIDLDMEDIKYDGRATTASQEALIVDDALDRARSLGVEDKLRSAIGKEWDADSFKEFLSNAQVREDLLTHMETGAYDNVQAKISEMSMLDYNGTFSSLPTIEKYRAAVRQLQQEAPAKHMSQAPVARQEAPKAAPVTRQSSVSQEKAKIAEARKAAEYDKKVSARKAKVDEDRRKATSLSKRKAAPKPKAKFDPMKLEGDELDKHLEFLITGGR